MTTYQEAVLGFYKQVGAQLPTPARIGQFTEQDLVTSRRGIEAYIRARNPDQLPLVDTILLIGEKLDPEGTERRSNFYRFAASDRFLGIILGSQNPQELAALIDRQTAHVVRESRFDFLYHLVPYILEACGPDVGRIENNLNAIRNLEQWLRPEDRKWLYTHERWGKGAATVDRGLGCRAVQIHHGNSDRVGQSIFTCIRVGERLDTEGKSVGHRIRPETRMNFYMGAAVEAIYVYRSNDNNLERALELTSKYGESIQDAATRRVFYDVIAETAYSIYGTDFDALERAFKACTDVSSGVDVLAREEFMLGVAAPAIRKFRAREGLAEALTKVAETGALIRNVGDIYETLFYRDVAPAILELGHSRERIESCCRMALRSILSYTSTQPTPTDTMAFTSRVLPKTFKAVARHVPREHYDSVIHEVQLFRREVVRKHGDKYLHDLMDKVVPSAIGAIFSGESRSPEREYPLLFTDDVIDPSKQLQKWGKVFIRMGDQLTLEQRDTFYSTELSEFAKIIVELDVDKVREHFGGNTRQLYENLKAIASVGLSVDKEERENFYRHAATRAMEVASADPDRVQGILSTALEGRSGVPAGLSRQYWCNAVDTIIQTSGGDLDYVRKCLNATLVRLPEVMIAGREYLHDFIPAVALSVGGNAQDFVSTVNYVINLIEDPQNHIIPSRKPNIYGIAIPALIQKFGAGPEVLGVLDRLVGTYLELGGDEAANLFGFVTPQLVRSSETIDDLHGRLEEIRVARALPETEDAMREALGDEVYDSLQEVYDSLQEEMNRHNANELHVSTRAVATPRGRIWRVSIGPENNPIISYILKPALPGREEADIEAHRAAEQCDLVPRILFAGETSYRGHPKGVYILDEALNIDAGNLEEHGRRFSPHVVQRIIDELAQSVHEMMRIGVVPRERQPHFHPVFLPTGGDAPKLRYLDVERIAGPNFELDDRQITDLVRATYDLISVAFDNANHLIRLFDENLLDRARAVDEITDWGANADTLTNRYSRAMENARRMLLDRSNPERDKWADILQPQLTTRLQQR